MSIKDQISSILKENLGIPHRLSLFSKLKFQAVIEKFFDTISNPKFHSQALKKYPNFSCILQIDDSIFTHLDFCVEIIAFNSVMGNTRVSLITQILDDGADMVSSDFNNPFEITNQTTKEDFVKWLDSQKVFANKWVTEVISEQGFNKDQYKQILNYYRAFIRGMNKLYPSS